jgi:L-ascorbate metabolism protein UlaG (beta-lactamase superfamily)
MLLEQKKHLQHKYSKMKKLYLLLALLIPSLLFSQRECKITYIANDGFLIETEGKKVLIDALFEPVNEVWCDSPSESTLNKMRNADSIFEDVDIIAVTHMHRDHFNEVPLIEHLLNNTDGILICPEQVRQVLKTNSRYSEISDRVIAITPDFLCDSTVSIKNIAIKVIRLEHGQYMIEDTISNAMINKHASIENTGFVFDISGIKLFHCGDTNPINEEEYSTFALARENLDIAMLERIFYGNDEAIEIIEKYIRPDKTILMHINPENKNMFLEYFKNSEEIKVFEKELETVIYPIDN